MEEGKKAELQAKFLAGFASAAPQLSRAGEEALFYA
jgi:hypothetical protein